MRWRIGTMVVAELAVITFVDDFLVVSRRQLGNVALILVDPVQQRVERGTKIEAPPAAIADFVNALRVFVELRGVDGIDQNQTVHEFYCLL